MFLVLLRFSQNKDGAGAFMADHNAWIARGFERGQFLMTGRSDDLHIEPRSDQFEPSLNQVL